VLKKHFGLGLCPSMQLVDLSVRQVHLSSRTPPSAEHVSLAQTFYDTLIAPNFHDEEMEPFEHWLDMLRATSTGAQALPLLCTDGSTSLTLCPYQNEFHILLLVEDDSNEIMAGMCCEMYNLSRTAFVTYLVTSPKFARRGLARRLLSTLGELDVPLQHEQDYNRLPMQILLEAHRPGVEDGVMDSLVRLRVYENLNFFPVKFDYAAPALEDGKHPVQSTFYLLLHTTDRTQIEASRVLAFIIEYFAASFTSKDDWACFVGMQAECAAVPDFPLLQLDKESAILQPKRPMPLAA